MKAVDITVYYLEMLAPPRRKVPAPRDSPTVNYVPHPSVPYFRFLYESVGRDYNWVSRGRLSDDKLAKVIQDPRDELYVLHVDGNPAGFVELDRRQPAEIELAQFGLIGDFIGQGLGKWFLQWTVDKAWSYQPKRLWLHTCSMDHPAALPNYKKAGFVEFKREASRKVF